MRSGAVILTSLAAACAAPQALTPSTPDFSHAETSDGAIVTRLDLKMRVEASPGFHTTPVSHRIAQFGTHPYEVSLAALISADEAVMVHAERVADASGASNYDDLPLAGWPNERFRLRSMCAAIDAPTVEEEHDLDFLQRHGWSPVGNLALEQYLVTTPDHNQEVIISLATRVPDCSRADEVQAALRRLRGKVTVTPA